MLVNLAYKTSEIIKNSLSQIIFKESINKTSDRIYCSIRDILILNPKFINILEKYDIKLKLDIFKTFLKEYSNVNKSTTIYKTIDSIYQIILVINTMLLKIKIILENHSKKYLAKYRTPDYGDKLEKLELYCKLLDKRFDLLCKLEKIIKITGLDFDNRMMKYNEESAFNNQDLDYTIIENN